MPGVQLGTFSMAHMYERVTKRGVVHGQAFADDQVLLVGEV